MAFTWSVGVTLKRLAMVLRNKPLATTLAGFLDGKDTSVVLKYATDSLAKMRFDLAGVTTGNTRVISVPDSNIHAESWVRRASGTIATAAVKTMHATPVSVIAAPGSGKYIEIVESHWWLDFGTVAYDAAAAGDTLVLKYTDASGATLTATIAGDTFGGASADAHSVALPATAAVVPVANAAVVAYISSTEWYAAAGDSPLKYDILYRVRTLEFT